MRDADVLVLPSLTEGSALVTYEAQAAGCALLVSEAAGAPCEHRREGLVHAPGDVAALTEHFRRVDSDRQAAAGAARGGARERLRTHVERGRSASTRRLRRRAAPVRDGRCELSQSPDPVRHVVSGALAGGAGVGTRVLEGRQQKHGWKRIVWPLAAPVLRALNWRRAWGDDWNHWWRDQFDVIRSPAHLGDCVELGCGPYTNTRLILEGRTANRVVCSDPLVRSYLGSTVGGSRRRTSQGWSRSTITPSRKAHFRPRASTSS